MPSLDKNQIRNIFDAAADKEWAARHPTTLADIKAALDFKFDNNVFTVEYTKEQAMGLVYEDLLIKTATGEKLDIYGKGDGTFFIDCNANSGNTAEQVVAAIGKFFGEHSNCPSPGAARAHIASPAYRGCGA